jgi:hypothetical protein
LTVQTAALVVTTLVVTWRIRDLNIASLCSTSGQQSHTESFELDKHNSLGFFQDIAEKDWLLRKKMTRQAAPLSCARVWKTKERPSVMVSTQLE